MILTLKCYWYYDIALIYNLKLCLILFYILIIRFECSWRLLHSVVKTMMEGAYGGGKAGAAFDPITFVQKPQVILRGLCLVSFSN